MTLPRSILPVLLALLVAMTSVQLAVARGQPQAAGQVELCADGSIIVIAMDREGNPIGPAHICPDVALALMVALAFPEPNAVSPVHMRRLVQNLEVQHAISHLHIATRARDPPPSV